MKKKIVSFFIIIMLLTTFLTAAKNIEKKPIVKVQEEIENLSFDEDNVPIWEVGDKWSYKVDDIVIDFEKENLFVYLEGKIENISLEVIKVNEDYELKFNAPITGNFAFITDFGAGPINITGELKRTTIGGVMTFNKNDLGLKKTHIIIDGNVLIKINELPDFPIQLIPRIPIPITVTLDINLSNPYQIINFPINTSKYWGLPGTNISLSGIVESIWLRIVSFINNIIRIPGVIPLIANLTGEDPIMLQKYSDILYNITPVFDIEYVLNEYLGGNVFEIQDVPPIFLCFSRDNITVPAGTFYAYNISLTKGLGNIYYAPEAGNIIKVVGNFDDILPFINNINAELISYSYNP